MALKVEIFNKVYRLCIENYVQLKKIMMNFKNSSTKINEHKKNNPVKRRDFSM